MISILFLSLVRAALRANLRDTFRTNGISCSRSRSIGGEIYFIIGKADEHFYLRLSSVRSRDLSREHQYPRALESPTWERRTVFVLGVGSRLDLSLLLHS